MKVPEEYVGKLVGMHLGRPVAMFEYGAHVVWDKKELITPAPMIKNLQGGTQSISMSETLMGALVVSVADDSITVKLLIPDPDGKSGVVMLKTIPTALILSIDAVDQVDAPMPTATSRAREAARKPLVQL